jgi:acyl-CoA thioester hydrolase
MPSAVSTLRVRYADTDQMGVVYYANYFVWFEVGRTDLLRTLGWTYREMEAEGVFLPVIEAHCEYRRPARYDEEIEVHTEGRLCSPVRMEFEYQVLLKATNEIAATGRTRHAALARDGRPCRLPDRIREAFA